MKKALGAVIAAAAIGWWIPKATAEVKTSGVGDVVLRVETSEPLPNIFGKADIFGRRRPTGVAVLQFMGVKGGKAIFIRSGTLIQSNATTTNESPSYVPNTGYFYLLGLR